MGRIEALQKMCAVMEADALLVTNRVNVEYLTGFSGTLGYLLVTGKKAWLLTDSRYQEQARFQVKDVEVTDIGQSAWKRLAELSDGEGLRELAVEAEHTTLDSLEKLRSSAGSLSVKGIPSPVAKMRQCKDADEILAIENSVALADEAYVHIIDSLRPGLVERDVALELELFMRRRGATAVSFDIIVASGPRSSQPHGVASDRRLEPGDAIVLDFGCVHKGYCSDLTRTVFLGNPSDRQRQVYEAVKEAQLAALRGIRPGMTGREADALGRDVLKSYGLDGFFGHGLGHGLGREIHESPRLSPPAEDILSSGMVVTVEPGVYLPAEFGVRIEDVAVVEAGGLRILTKSSKELCSL